MLIRTFLLVSVDLINQTGFKKREKINKTLQNSRKNSSLEYNYGNFRFTFAWLLKLSLPFLAAFIKY